MKNYRFSYNGGDAAVVFRVDESVFTEEMAKAALEFFTWPYDAEGDLRAELLKKYALRAIEVAITEGAYGVRSWFAEAEGFLALDDSTGIDLPRTGIELIGIIPYYFDEDDLEMFIE